MSWRERRGSKYGATRQEYNGAWYQSKKEAGYAAELDLRKKCGDILDWVRQVKISLDVNGQHITNYIIDFIAYHPDGRQEYIEVKGFETEVWRLKWKIFCALYEQDKNNILVVVK